MKILITGAAGFVGSQACNELAKNHEVLAVDDLSFGNINNVETSNFQQRGFETLSEQLINQYDILLHCATANIIYAQKDPVQTFRINALNTIELFNRFKGKIIYTSTASVYGSAANYPTKENEPKGCYNAYDTSKLTAERYLQSRGGFTTLRLSNVYGHGQRPDNPYCGVIARFIHQQETDGIVSVIGTGEATRDYTYISDVVESIKLAVNSDPINTAVNISGQNELNSLQLAELIGATQIKYIPKRNIDNIPRRLLDITKADELLNWKPKISMTEGIKLTKKYYKLFF